MKKTAAIFDKIIWSIIKIFPFVIGIISYYKEGTAEYMIDVLSWVSDNSQIASTLLEVFNSILNIGTNNVFAHYGAYIFLVVMVHLFIDFMLFIPEIAIKCIERSKGETEW